MTKDPADPASDWQKDGYKLLYSILSISTGKIVTVLLFYSSFYGEGPDKEMLAAFDDKLGIGAHITPS